MSEDALTCLMWVMNALFIVWTPVALIFGKRSGESLTIFAEIIIVFAVIVFELIRRAWKCSK